MLSILDIVDETTADGPGFRTSVYCAGCHHQCPGCHNPESWDINQGKQVPVSEVLSHILSDPFTDVTFSGGDPMYQAAAFTQLAQGIKAQSQKNIWCYTGFTIETLLKMAPQRELLQYIDVLVDGPFIQSLRDEDLYFRGSSNQRLINVPETLRTGQITLWQYQLGI